MVTKVVFIVLKVKCEAISLAIKLIPDTSLWAECVPQKSCSSFQRWSARRPASHKPNSRQTTLGEIRASNVVFIVSKVECKAASLAIKAVQSELLRAECEAASLAIRLKHVTLETQSRRKGYNIVLYPAATAAEPRNNIHVTLGWTIVHVSLHRLPIDTFRVLHFLTRPARPYC